MSTRRHPHLTAAPIRGIMTVLRHQSQSGLNARIVQRHERLAKALFFVPHGRRLFVVGAMRGSPWGPPVPLDAGRSARVVSASLRLNAREAGCCSPQSRGRHVARAVSFDWSQSPNNHRDHQPVAVGARTRPVGRRVEVGPPSDDFRLRVFDRIGGRRRLSLPARWPRSPTTISTRRPQTGGSTERGGA